MGGMNRRLLLCAVFALPLVCGAETIDLGNRGRFSVTVPKDWTFSAQKMEDTGYALTLSPPGDANAKCILTLVYAETPEPLSKERVQSEVLSACEQFVDASVEKRKVLQEFNVPGAYGVYCVFTDASMVGKPVTRDAFKAVAMGEVHLSDDVTMSASMLFDDVKGPEFQAMLAAVSSVSISGAR
jgi:hypothetical protein